jgi:taurine dioxygenase
MNMNIVLAEAAIGASVTGIRLQEVDEQAFGRLRDLLHDRGVVVVRGQHLSEEEQIGFARRFGELQQIFIKEALSPRHPELFFVSNVVQDGKPLGSSDAGKFWHTDGAYLPNPHSVSMLYALEVPRGADGVPLGDTLFAGMSPAYDALPQALRARLEGLRGVQSLHHRYAIKDGKTEESERTGKFLPVSHPLVIRHPVTSRPCLYLSEGYTTHIEGLPAEESAVLIDQLCRHVTDPAFVYRHRWQEGDMLLWDNRSTLHRATFDYQPHQRRVMRRATVAGAPLVQCPSIPAGAGQDRMQ